MRTRSAWLRRRFPLCLLGITALLMAGCPWQRAAREAEEKARMEQHRAEAAQQEAVRAERDKAAQRELKELSTAVMTFCTEWNVDYMPSTITLNDGNPLSPSSQFLIRMFRRLNVQVPLAWNGQNANAAVTLQGHHCLVFFLGGIPVKEGALKCQGFSTNPQNPTDMTSPIKAPLFEFDPSRLRRDPKNGFLYYLDPYGKAPYAYFSAGRTPEGYNPAGDCPDIGLLGFDCGVPKPYLKQPGSYWLPNSWQIISAGADGKFGPGGVVWDNNHLVPGGSPGADDLTNFASDVLSKPSRFEIKDAKGKP